jgi:hypothetical protein
MTAVVCLSDLGAAPVSWRVAGWLLLIPALGAAVLVLWCLTTLVVPRRRSAATTAQVPTDVPAGR